MEKVRSILTHEFRAHYSLENPSIVTGISELPLAFPMVCFCDLPLAQTATHMEKYGNTPSA